MAAQQIRFDDGATYEKFMGIWSRKVGDTFLNWVAPQKGLSWIDVGCGNGAFTELLAESVSPSRVLGIDPSDAQLSYARQRHTAGMAEFVKGDAMALPVVDESFDAAAMALVIQFVPQPLKAVTEMRRVLRPGGPVVAYTWDMMGGGFPLNIVYEELDRMGIPPVVPPSAEATRIDTLRSLWTDVGLSDVDTCEIHVERIFPDFEDLWATTLTSPRLSLTVADLTAEACDTLKSRVRAELSSGASGAILCTARAHAVRGRVPG